MNEGILLIGISALFFTVASCEDQDMRAIRFCVESYQEIEASGYEPPADCKKLVDQGDQAPLP